MCIFCTLWIYHNMKKKMNMFNILMNMCIFSDLQTFFNFPKMNMFSILIKHVHYF